ncbi:MAG: hypothetical protein Kow0022_06380 [Phycisphaerales bacterium]
MEIRVRGRSVMLASMQSRATTVEEYLEGLCEDRRRAISAVRDVIRANLGRGYEEGMQYGMIGYFVPHRVYPPGYHCDPRQPLPFVGLASQRNHMAIYLFCIYASEEDRQWFIEAWTASGRKLDMGKGCVRFRRLEDVPLEVVGEAIRRVPVERLVAVYEENLRRPASDGGRRASKASGGSGKKKTKRKGAAAEADTKAASGKRSGQAPRSASAKASKKKVSKKVSKRSSARKGGKRQAKPRGSE